MAISFAHPSEEEYGRLVEAVTPDFYLPLADVYVECTEMKPSLACRKRRKLRKLRERYGEIVVYPGARSWRRSGRKYARSAVADQAACGSSSA
jgi:hypothetical protein